MEPLNDGFDQPTEVSNVLLAFPGTVLHLMPAYDAIPNDFKRGHGRSQEWISLQRQWFFAGLPSDALEVKEGIDSQTAWRHLKCIQGSFEPKHEYKEAAVAWLMSRWFDISPKRPMDIN